MKQNCKILFTALLAAAFALASSRKFSVVREERQLKKTKAKKGGKKSSKSSKSKSAKSKPRPVCLLTGLEYGIDGTIDPQFCSSSHLETGLPLNPRGYFQTEVGTIAVNRQNAGVLGITTECAVPFAFENVLNGDGTTTGAVCLTNTCQGDDSLLGCNRQKGEVALEVPQGTPLLLSQVEKLSFTYNPITYGATSSVDDVYMNIYTIRQDNDSQATPCTFYSCRLDITPTAASVNAPAGQFTTFDIGLDTPISNVRDYRKWWCLCRLVSFNWASLTDHVA